jgi:Uma2 family endonuclease
MRHAPDAGLMTVQEYLRREARGADVRHEYVAGVTYAMTGTTLRHNLLLLNIAARFREAAAAAGCHVFVNDVKVRAAADVFYYPDVLVACGELDDQAVYVKEPCCIVEVTSASTRRIDRREKLLAYLAMPSVQAYLIVDQRRTWVEAHLRGADGAWVRSELTAADRVIVPCIGYTLSIANVYEGVSLPAVGEPEPDEYDA